MKTSISLPDELVAQARALDINISALTRDALEARIAQLQGAQEQGMQLIKTSQEGMPVAFWGRLVGQHSELERMAFLTEKGSLVVLSFGDAEQTAGVGDYISEIHPTPQDFFDAYASAIRESLRSGDTYDRTLAAPTNDWLTEVAEAVGVTHHRVLDV